MLAGDIVHFSIATDKRNGAVRATNVSLHKLIESQREPGDRETVRAPYYNLYTVYVYIYSPGLNSETAQCAGSMFSKPEFNSPPIIILIRHVYQTCMSASASRPTCGSQVQCTYMYIEVC